MTVINPDLFYLYEILNKHTSYSHVPNNIFDINIANSFQNNFMIFQSQIFWQWSIKVKVNTKHETKLYQVELDFNTYL